MLSGWFRLPVCRGDLALLAAHLRRLFDDFAGGSGEYPIEPLAGVQVHVPQQPLAIRFGSVRMESRKGNKGRGQTKQSLTVSPARMGHEKGSKGRRPSAKWSTTWTGRAVSGRVNDDAAAPANPDTAVVKYAKLRARSSTHYIVHENCFLRRGPSCDTE